MPAVDWQRWPVVDPTLIRYGCKAVGGLVVGLALLTVWVDVVGIPPAWAALFNMGFLGVVGTAVLDRWVYRETMPATTLRGFATRFAGAQGAMLTSKAVNYLVYLALLSVVPYQAAWVVGAVVSFGLSFLLTRGWFARVG